VYANYVYCLITPFEEERLHFEEFEQKVVELSSEKTEEKRKLHCDESCNVEI
jgi:hypothetical protein